MTRPDLTIAGGGAVGLVAALALAGAGMRVRLVDPGLASASSVAAGMLAPAFEAVFDEVADDQLADLMRARDLWPALAARTGIALDRRGALAVGSRWELDTWEERLERLGFRATRRSDGLFTDEDWRLEPTQAIAALQAAAVDGGVELVHGEVTEAHLGEILVIATGASRSLAGVAPELGELTPIKGHILAAPDLRRDGPVLRFAGGYVCPSVVGVLVGASMEVGRCGTDIDPGIVGQLRVRAARFAPELASARLVARTGVRAATPGGRPLVGRSRTPGVFLAVGARRNGWLLAPLIAERLVEVMSQG